VQHHRHLHSCPSADAYILAAVDAGGMEGEQLSVVMMIAGFCASSQIHHRVQNLFFRTCRRRASVGSRNPAFQRSLNVARTLDT